MGLMRGRRLQPCTRQGRSSESSLQDHDNIKRHWTDKCCNKFKKPTGSPGDPKRDMMLRCQQILKKSASSIMGADLQGDKGLELSEDSESGEEEENYKDNVDGGLVDGVAVVGAALLVDEQAVVEEIAGGIGSRTQSRGPTPTSQADNNNDGGHRISFLLLCHPYNI
jgi:hypothetical protein